MKYLSTAPNHSNFMFKDSLLSLAHVYLQLSFTNTFKGPCDCVCVSLV